MSHSEYDFAPEQKELLLRVASRMKVFGILVIASQLLSLAMVLLRAIGMDIGGGAFVANTISTAVGMVIYLVVAMLTLAAASSLKAVAHGEGTGMPQMVVALSSLKRLFGVQYWLIVSFLLLVVVIFITMIGVAAVA